MKWNNSILLSFLVLAFLVHPVVAHEGHSDNPRRTWSTEVETGDTFSFTVDTFTKNGEPVENASDVEESSVITVDILGNLSEIDVSSFEGLFLTDYDDYFQVTVDESSSQMFDTVSAFLFVYPNIRDEGDGEMTNVFRESVETDSDLLLYPLVSQTSNSIDGNDFKAEIVTDDVTFDYNYDIETGILNSYTEKTDEYTLELSSNFSLDRLPLSIGSILVALASIFVLRSIRLKARKQN